MAFGIFLPSQGVHLNDVHDSKYLNFDSCNLPRVLYSFSVIAHATADEVSSTAVCAAGSVAIMRLQRTHTGRFLPEERSGWKTASHTSLSSILLKEVWLHPRFVPCEIFGNRVFCMLPFRLLSKPSSWFPQRNKLCIQEAQHHRKTSICFGDKDVFIIN